MTHYREVVIETYLGVTTHASGGLRARPVQGQGFPLAMHTECSTKMRHSHPVGTRFLIQARVKSKEGGEPFLYCHYSHPYKVLSDDDFALWQQRSMLGDMRL